VGKISASLDTSHYRGAISKSIVVRTNDAKLDSVVLELRATIVSAIDVLPNETPIIRGTVDDLKPVVVTVTARDKRAFDIVKIEAPPTVSVQVAGGAPGKPAKPRKGTVASGRSSYEVTIAPAKAAPIGHTIATVVLDTSHPKAHTVQIRAMVTVTGRVVVQPAQLFMAAVTNNTSQHVKISKPAGTPLVLGEVSSTDADVRATVTPVTEGREYDLAVSYVGQPGRGAVRARVMVKTNEPGQDVLVIPVSGRF
jgi:hypothetical protein